jgi:hypothetical protein
MPATSSNDIDAWHDAMAGRSATLHEPLTDSHLEDRMKPEGSRRSLSPPWVVGARRTIVFVGALLACFPAIARAGGVDAAWGSCYPNGSRSVTFDPTPGIGTTYDLFLDITLDSSFPNFVAADIYLDVAFPNSTSVPPWWELLAGGCNNGSLDMFYLRGSVCAASSNVMCGSSAATCSGSGLVAAQIGYGAPNNLRLVGVITRPSTSPVTLTAGRPFLARLTFSIDNPNSFGPCSGVDAGAIITVSKVILNDLNSNALVLNAFDSGSHPSVTANLNCPSVSLAYADHDGDGNARPEPQPIVLGVCGSSPPPGFTSNRTVDCDDDNPLIGGLIAAYTDADHDGYGVGTPFQTCVGPGTSAVAGDCDDADPKVHPGALDRTCNGIDDNCNASIDEGVSGCVCVEHAPGLVGWWRGNGNASDAAGPNAGTLVNGATASASGKVGQAFTLDGVDDYIGPLGTTASYAFIENTGTFTVEAWIKLDDPNALTQQAITAQTTTTIEKGHFFIWDNLSGQKRLRLALMREINGSPAIDVSTPPNVITDANWHHVAAVGTGATVDFFVDGTRYITNGVIATGPTGSASRPLDIGRTPAASIQCPFDGQIDEVGIYDRALSTSEIRAIYNAGAAGMCSPGCVRDLPGLVGWWPAEGEAADRSPYHNDGSARDGMTYGAGKVGRGFLHNGSSYAEIPNAASLQITTQLTMAAWINPNDVSSTRQIISKFSLTPGNFGYQMNLFPTGSLRMDVSGNGSTYTLLNSPSGTLSVGAWAHVAATFNAGVSKLYVNGVEVAAATLPVTSIYPATVPLFIGVGHGGVQYFWGLIDEPMVFNRALSAAEIQSLYTAGSSGMCGLGLVNGVGEAPDRPRTLELSAPWPNPALRTAHIRFALPAAARVRAEVFDVVGRRVATLIDDQRLEAGEHRVTWSGLDASARRVRAGVYQVRVSSEGAIQARQVALIGP